MIYITQEQKEKWIKKIRKLEKNPSYLSNSVKIKIYKKLLSSSIILSVETHENMMNFYLDSSQKIEDRFPKGVIIDK